MRPGVSAVCRLRVRVAIGSISRQATETIEKSGRAGLWPAIRAPGRSPRRHDAGRSGYRQARGLPYGVHALPGLLLVIEWRDHKIITSITTHKPELAQQSY